MVSRSDPEHGADRSSEQGTADIDAEGDEAEAALRSMSIGEALHGERLDKAVVAVASEFSRNHLQALIRDGHVHIDGLQARMPAQRVRAGQVLSMRLVATAQSRAYRAEHLPLHVVFEDADLLVVDKAPGMVVHPAAGNWSATLLNGLLFHHPASAALPRAGIVHRLDKDTSGLMVVGKTLQAVTALIRAIAAREVDRRYFAIVTGPVPADRFTVEAPIGRDPVMRTRMAVTASGKPARTDFERIAGNGVATALRCTLHSGRTHQIRVHLAARDLPIAGDRLYAGTSLPGIERQALHAAALAFAHPVSGQAMHFISPLPADLADAWGRIAGAKAPLSFGPFDTIDARSGLARDRSTPG